MPLTPPGLQGLLTPLVTAANYTGTSAPSLVSAIANAVSSWLTTLIVKTTDIGLMGVGTGIGKAIITPASLIGPLQGMATANGIKGTAAPALMAAIGNGVSSFVSSMGMVQTTHPGIGVGTGIGQLIIPGPASLQGLLMAQLVAMQIKGTSAISFATAVASGLSTGMASTIVSVVITGSPTLPPPVTGSGVGIGKLV
jgi:hypothetical protein